MSTSGLPKGWERHCKPEDPGWYCRDGVGIGLLDAELVSVVASSEDGDECGETIPVEILVAVLRDAGWTCEPPMEDDALPHELEAILAELEGVWSRLADFRCANARGDDREMQADTLAALNAISEARGLLCKAIAQQRRSGT